MNSEVEIAPAESAVVGEALVAAPPVSGRALTLYRTFWRWHFYAGLLVAPVLLIVATTGAMYIFKHELEAVLYPTKMFVEPQPTQVPFANQLKAARDSLPEGYRARRVTVFANPARATEISFQGPDLPVREVFVDPYTGSIQGELSDDSLFRIILKLHRTLFLGLTGRIVVELMVGWTIILALTGLYLWWPRKARSTMGIWLPRLRAHPYVVLRDLHALAGFYLLPVILTIACTGLMYTKVWGSGYGFLAKQTGAFNAVTDPPPSTSPPKSKRMPLEDAFALARSHFPDATALRLALPTKQDGSLLFTANSDSGPTNQGSLCLDRSSGEVLAFTPLERAPVLAQWSAWNYALHTGSVLGVPTKIIWLVACMILIALPVTGLWMWWQRRPRGRTGFPRQPDVPLPWWLIGAISVLGVVLPVFGASVALLFVGEWLVRRLPRRVLE